MKMMMMTTTSSMNEDGHLELGGEPESHAQSESHELPLSDQHAELLGHETLNDSAANPVISTEPLSLPAALCDDLLLEEINSIPDKMGFKIGDVADMLGIKQYVLRYWETEFDLLKPKKASNNQRMYTRKDVENAFLIRKLLHRDRFSIEGARNALKELKAHVKKEKDYSQVVHRLESIHDRIEDLVLEIRRTRQLFK
jgi:DNA-binding transcriptional MerR regulator